MTPTINSAVVPTLRTNLIQSVDSRGRAVRVKMKPNSLEKLLKRVKPAAVEKFSTVQTVLSAAFSRDWNLKPCIFPVYNKPHKINATSLSHRNHTYI